MDALFRIASYPSHARADAKKIAHEITIHNHLSTIKTSLFYEVDADMNPAIFCIPKSDDATLDDLEVEISGPGVSNQQNPEKMKAKLNAEAQKLVQNVPSKDLLIRIASEDVQNSTLVSFTLGALKKGYKVSIVLKHNFDTKVIYSADRTLYYIRLPKGLSLFYSKPATFQANNVKLKAFYDRLKSITQLTSVVINLEGVPNADNVTVSGYLKDKIQLLNYPGINKQVLKTSFQQGVQLSLQSPTYSDWENFRIDVSVPLAAGEDRTKHQEKMYLHHTTEQVANNSPLPVTTILRVRHHTPFPLELQNDMQNQIQLRDPDIPEIEIFKKYMNTRTKYDVILVIDQSSSMNDDGKHDMAIAGLKFILKSLPASGCRFNIYTFASTHKKHYQAMQEATDANINAALNLVETFESSGCTNLFGAAKDIFNTNLEAGRKRIVVLLSDGDLTDNKGETIQLISSKLSADKNTVLCGLCVGNDGPRDLFETLKQHSNGGIIDYPQNMDSLSESYIKVFKSTVWPTYELTNFEITGAKVAYLHPIASRILAPMAEVTSISFLLTDVKDKVTIKYDAYIGGKKEASFSKTIDTAGKQYSEAESFMKVEAQKLISEISVREEKSKASSPHDPIKNNTLNDSNLVLKRTTKLSFQDDLTRLGLRFNMLTPYTSLVVQVKGSNTQIYTASETYEPAMMYARRIDSFLSATRNQSIISDLRNVSFGSSIQLQFASMLEDEALFPDFNQIGKIVYSDQAANKLLDLRVITPDRVQYVKGLSDPETRNYHFTKFVIIMILHKVGNSQRWSAIISKACQYMEECRAKNLHQIPTKNPFAKVPAAGGMGSYMQ
jgi:Mg-chelatase subunit ChlD